MKTSAKHLLTAASLTLALVIACNSQAADNNGAKQDVDTQANGQAAKKSGRDPVAAAFRVPSGTVLNKQQRAALDQLKADNEDDLKQAFDAMAHAKTGSERAKALQDIRDVKATIRSGIDNILAMNSGGGNNSGANQPIAPGYDPAAAYGPAAAYYAMADSGYYGYPYGRGWYGNYGDSGYRPYRYGPPPYYYNGKYYGTVNQPVAAKTVNKPLSNGQTSNGAPGNGRTNNVQHTGGATTRHR